MWQMLPPSSPHPVCGAGAPRTQRAGAWGAGPRRRERLEVGLGGGGRGWFSGVPPLLPSLSFPLNHLKLTCVPHGVHQVATPRPPLDARLGRRDCIAIPRPSRPASRSQPVQVEGRHGEAGRPGDGVQAVPFAAHFCGERRNQRREKRESTERTALFSISHSTKTTHNQPPWWKASPAKRSNGASGVCGRWRGAEGGVSKTVCAHRLRLVTSLLTLPPFSPLTHNTTQAHVLRASPRVRGAGVLPQQERHAGVIGDGKGECVFATAGRAAGSGRRGWQHTREPIL